MITVRTLENGKYEVAEEYVVPSAIWDKPLIVPKGFIYNGLSVPDIALPIIDDSTPGGLEASAIHDYIYNRRGDLDCGTIGLGRDDADLIFYKVLRHYGCGWLSAKLAYLAVCTFGGGHWGESNS